MAGGAIIAVLALLGLAAAGGGSKKSTTKTPTKGVIGDAWTDKPEGDKSIATAPTTGPQKESTFTDLGTKNKIMSADFGIDRRVKMSPVEPAAEYWPGLNSLPGAWRDAAMNLVRTLPYNMAMGKVPLETSTSADPDRLYNFAREVEDAGKSGAIGGFGVNVDLAIKELLTAARTLERVRGYESPYRWGAAYGL